MSDGETYDSDYGDSLVFSPSSLTRRYDTDELIIVDRYSGRYFVRCHSHRGFCRHSRVVYTDGACRNNGRYGSESGIGIAFGQPDGDPDTGEDYQFSIPVDDNVDPGGRRTSQRAELLAALHGLKKISKHDAAYFLEQVEEYGFCHPNSPEIVIATDSEYVVKGMSEWLPRWRANGLRKSNGDKPSNIDLFLDLGVEIRACQYRYGCKVKFWKINRAYNSIADELAKEAARETEYCW